MDMMLSPFPGMDPFLERPSEWSSVHVSLIVAIRDYLNLRLAPDFVVKAEQRVYISTPEESRKESAVPDVYIVRRPSSSQSTAVGEITAPTLVEPIYDIETVDRYLEIRDTHSREVVTTIEILSPFNKQKGKRQEAYLKKRRTILGSKIHWIEIDLLRAGGRPEEIEGKSDYYALLKRGGILGPYEVWYIDVRDSLPTIAVPTTASRPDIPLDLQFVFNDMYKRAAYAVDIDYIASVPSPQLDPADARWVDERIEKWLALQK